MASINLGKLVALDVRGVWKHEANDFTPWLAQGENLKLLSDALRLGDLAVEATERQVGRFSADIVAKDDDDRLVLIENQLEPTDHRHLGQVLTYLAGLEGDASVIWVATLFLEEHRAAIDWLNANTNSRFDFFGVEVEVLQIGDSVPAPRFNVVCKPNEWSREVGRTARRVTADPSNETQVIYQEYWTALRIAYESGGGHGRFPKPWARHWLPFKIGRSGFQINVGIYRPEKRIRVELYMHQRDTSPKQAFKQLILQRGDIEEAIEIALDWQELPESRASRVATYLDGFDIYDREKWPDQHRSILGMIQKFRTVFAPRVKELKLDELPTSTSPEAEDLDLNSADASSP